MTLYYLTPISSIFQYFDNTGTILAGGKVYTYQAGTNTPIATYTDITGSVPNANPLVLSSAGRFNNVQMWQAGGVNIKVIITDASGNQLGPVFDQMSGINDPAATLASLANPNTGFGADIVSNAVRSYDTFASMRAANVPSLVSGRTLIVYVQGGSTPADNGGGAFRWNAASTAADDNLNVIKPASAGSLGRYLRIYYPLVNAGFFPAALTGISGTNTQQAPFSLYNTIEWNPAAKQHQFVSIYDIGTFTGTSNANTLTITGIPSLIQPSDDRHITCGALIDNGTILSGECIVYGSGGGNAGTMAMALSVVSGSNVGFNLTGFTASGTKGLAHGFQISYNL